jgi:hypothetical protein
MSNTQKENEAEPAVLERPADKPADKRLNLVLSASVYDDLTGLAKERRTTMTEIVRLGLGLVKVAINEMNRGHKLVVTTANGQVIKELVLPG